VDAFEPERVALTVRSEGPAWVVLRDAYSSDWEAWLDGETRLPIGRADLLFRAVRVPAGEHTLELRYAPAWWWPGSLISLAGLLGLSACLRVGLRRGRAP
jgi:uncharacterized membrane protein YfhO